MCVSNFKESADVKGVFYIKKNNSVNRRLHIEHIIDATFFSLII